VKKVHDALYASKIISYAQGLDLIKTMGEKKNWGLDLGRIASIWRGGCIIRARFLNRITDAYRTNASLANLMLDPFFKDVLSNTQQNWREVVSIATLNGIPVPAFSAPPSATTTATAPPASPPTSSKPSATSSVPTPTSAPTSPKARCSTRNGLR
jgi:6-phosphogluconate dehydrogenase